MIAKFRQSVESPERSSSLLVVVVCMCAARLPIQLSMERTEADIISDGRRLDFA
jgi:hypothetical protein